jgi:hypothetical protein
MASTPGEVFLEALNQVGMRIGTYGFVEEGILTIGEEDAENVSHSDLTPVRISNQDTLDFLPTIAQLLGKRHLRVLDKLNMQRRRGD